MKKFFSLLTAVCVLFMVGCSDDDDDKKMNKTYKDSDLTFKLNDNSVAGATVKFTSNDLKNGVIALTNVFPGEPETKINVKMDATTESNTYDISGNSDNGGRKVTLTGTAGSKLTLDVTFEIVSPIAGVWQPLLGSAATPQEYALNLIITPKAADATINMNGVMNLDEIPVAALTTLIGGTLEQVFTQMVDFKLDMKKTGSLVANWAPLGEAGFTPGSSQMPISYNVVDKQVFVKLPLREIIGGLLTPRAEMQLPDLDIALPLNLEVSSDKLTASVTQQMITPYLPLIEALIPKLAEFETENEFLIDNGITGVNLGKFMPEILRVIKESSVFTIEINMMPSE